MKYFENTLVYVGGEGLKRTSLRFGEKIVSFGTETGGEKIDLPADAVVLPGFIDEHIHGAGGAGTMDASEQALATIADTLAGEGTTAFLAATTTQSPEAIGSALNAVKAYRAKAPKNGAELLGAHLEGPFISMGHRGAHLSEYIVPPDVSVFEHYQKESGGNIRIVTLAPEVEGGDELIRYLCAHDVIASLGHTSGTYDDIVRAVAAGAKHSTHTYNAQSALHHREIGMVGSALLLDELTCELICDTVHVSVPAMKLLCKCKGTERIVLVTDAIRAKGVGDGESELGGQKIIVKDGVARLEDGTVAGGVGRMNEAVKNLVEKVGVPFERAVDCASLNPARALGLDGERGSIATGKRADLTVLDGAFRVIATYRGGEVVYRR